jgi:hypothetical protein
VYRLTDNRFISKITDRKTMIRPTQNLTMSSFKAQIYGLLAFLIGFPALLSPFYWMWGLDKSRFVASPTLYILSAIILFAGVIIHELIHGMTAIWHGGVSWRQVKFGVQWKSLTPYCHSVVPMRADQYRLVVLMPLIVLGLVPYAAALLFNNVGLLAFGTFFTLAAAGDLMIIWLMRHLRSNEQVQDHPTKVGLLVTA